MTPTEETEIKHLLIVAVKELGEIAECIIKDDPRLDHWKEEMSDLCGLAISPMLEVAKMKYDDACLRGRHRKQMKIEERHS